MPTQNFVNQFFTLFSNPSFDLSIFGMLLKVMLLIGFFLYILFAGIVVRQVFLMTRTVETTLAPFLKIFSMGYLVLAVVVFLFVLMI